MKGWQVALIVLLLARLSEARFKLWSLGSQEDESSAPDFCRGAACPPYEVISKGSTYELREYTKSETLISPRSASHDNKAHQIQLCFIDRSYIDI